ncbi:MAG: hypothetical protein KKI08_26070 [Armatimonadetes bacterium]|nr:hypothetical protein [Armatimonadota bacterium]
MARSLCLLALVGLALPVKAEVVQLVRPGEALLTLQPGSARALVRETRALTLPAGESSVSFSWTAANVDWSSVALSLAEGAVGEASRMPGQDKTLVWQVNMPRAATTEAVVSYFLDGVKWLPSYVLTLNAAEGWALLESSVRLTNETGAPLRGVCVQIGPPGVALADRPAAPEPAARPSATPASAEPGATTTIPYMSIPDIPAVIHYTYRAERSGHVERALRLGLDQVGLAATEVPDGPMLIQDAADPQVPIFRTQLDFQPGKEFEVALGPEPDVVVERKLLSSKRNNLDFDRFGRVTGLDTTEEFLISARNHLDRAITLEVVETVLSTWDLKGPDPAQRETSSARWDLPVGPAANVKLRFSLVKHSGTRVKK